MVRSPEAGGNCNELGLGRAQSLAGVPNRHEVIQGFQETVTPQYLLPTLKGEVVWSCFLLRSSFYRKEIVFPDENAK